MPELRILNVSGNKRLSTLPPELATCENLGDLVFDVECISSPSRDVLATGVQNILKFLSTGELSAQTDYASEDKLLTQSKVTSSRIMGNTITTKKFMDKEKFLMSQEESLMENQMHKEHQKKKEEMLKALLEQQKQSETAVNKMQTEKDVERKKLVNDIVDCKFISDKKNWIKLKLFPMPDELSSTLVVEGLLSLKKGPDTALLELENDARDALLEKVSKNCAGKGSLVSRHMH